MSTLAWRVDELASSRGWSARELADAAGLDEKTVRNVLSGRSTRVDLDTIARLADALEVEPGALWRTESDRAEAWERAAGVAGQATPEEVAAVVAGDWSEMTDPALERAARSV